MKVSMGNGVVLHCLARLGHGGVERRRLSIVECKTFQGTYQHVVICQEATPELARKFERAGCQVFEIGVARHVFDLGWYLRAVQIARAFQPEIIHGAVFEGNLLATAISFFQRKSILILEETINLRARRWTGMALTRMLISRAKLVVGVAPEITELLATKFPRSKKKLRVVTNGVERAAEFSTEEISLLRNQVELAKSDTVVGFSGRLENDHKRISDLIRAIETLARDFPRLKLLILGDGPSKKSLLELAESFGIRERVVFAGYKENSRDFLSVMDVFALPSAGEGMPLALIEAMHAGLPCVASAVGGVPQLLDQGRAGILIEPGDVEALASSLRGLLAEPKLRIQFGTRAKGRAIDLYSSQTYLERLEMLWKEARVLRDSRLKSVGHSRKS